jgi:GT2 family glycosyltransferase
MESRLVSVVLVTWNSAPWLPRCLEGIRRQTHSHRELSVVDNASADDSVALVAADATRVIRNETNRGFSAAVNQAIAVARGELVQLVNPDCHLEPDYIARLVDVLRDDVGMATGKLMRADGNGIDTMGIRMTRSGRHLDITDVGQTLLSVPPTRDRTDKSVCPTQPFEVFGVSGAAAMYSMVFLRDVAIVGEIFDEDFFAFREDADLAWRGRLFGWRAVCDPAALGDHVRRVTPDVRRSLPANINMHGVKNRFLLRLKNEGLYLALRNAPFELTRDLIVILAALTIERTSLPAFSWLWRNHARLHAKRDEIQRRRKVSDRALARWFR